MPSTTENMLRWVATAATTAIHQMASLTTTHTAATLSTHIRATCSEELSAAENCYSGPFLLFDVTRSNGGPGNDAFAVLFGICIVLHTFQAFYTIHNGRSATSAMAAFAELAAYVMKEIASNDEENLLLQQVAIVVAAILILLAPLAVNMAAYAAFCRLIRNTDVVTAPPDIRRLRWPGRAGWGAQWYMWALLVASVVMQITACSLTLAFVRYGSRQISIQATQTTITVFSAAEKTYTAGLATQAAFLVLVGVAAGQAIASLLKKRRHGPPAAKEGQDHAEQDDDNAESEHGVGERIEDGYVMDGRAYDVLEKRRSIVMLQLSATLAVIVMLMIRIIYRLIIAAKSLDSNTTSLRSKVDLYVLDAIPTLLALTLLCICNADWALPASSRPQPQQFLPFPPQMSSALPPQQYQQQKQQRKKGKTVQFVQPVEEGHRFPLHSDSCLSAGPAPQSVEPQEGGESGERERVDPFSSHRALGNNGEGGENGQNAGPESGAGDGQLDPGRFLLNRYFGSMTPSGDSAARGAPPSEVTVPESAKPASSSASFHWTSASQRGSHTAEDQQQTAAPSVPLQTQTPPETHADGAEGAASSGHAHEGGETAKEEISVAKKSPL